jgi:hypothetical protein
MVRSTVEEMLNQPLDAEADRLCSAGRYEHSDSRTDTGTAIAAAAFMSRPAS